MNEALFSDTATFAPYWWDRTPRPNAGFPSLPKAADVVVIGSGYSGLHAALQTARAGRSTVVLDAGDLGWGCSSRNGGQVSASIKPDLKTLTRQHGADRAQRLIDEGKTSLSWLGSFVREEGIDCDFQLCGRFHGAHTQRAFDHLARQYGAKSDDTDSDAILIDKAHQQGEIGTDGYFGGVVFPNHASLDPGRYHQGLLERVVGAGATPVAHCPVTQIEKQGTGWRLTTANGTISAREVVVATNGYTGAATPWLRRRVIPIGSYVIATEPLPESTMARLMPKGRNITDTRHVVYYYRPSPDGRRILFGGRVSLGETDPRKSGPKLHQAMSTLFPELVETRISHSWCGFVAYTFDEMMHVGWHDGLHYATGYCGSGVGMASYLGMRLGHKVVQSDQGETAFDGLTFPTRPFYTGRPWFLSAAVWYYGMRDRLGL